MESKQISGTASYLSAVRRRRRLMLFIALPIVLSALVAALALPDVYQASGMVSIEQARLEGVKSSTRAATDDYVQEYVRSVSNELLTEKVLRRAAAEIVPYPELKDDVGAAARRMIKDTRIDMVRSTILDPISGREREIISGFKITYASRDPKLAARGASWLTAAFIQADRDTREGREADTATFYATEAERVATTMAVLEQKLADYKRRNYGRLPELTAVNLNSMDRMERDLEGVQLQAGMLRKDRIFIEQRLGESTSNNTNADELTRAEDEYRRKSATYDSSHPDLISLRRQIETLKLAGTGGGGASLQDQLDAQRATLAEARQRYSADHPDIRKISRNIAALEKRLAAGEKVAPGAGRTAVSEQLQVQLSSTNTQIASLEARASELRGKMGVVENRVASTPEVEREGQILTRDMNQARTKYEQLLGNKMDADINRAAISGGKADEFRLMQPATQPSAPAKPARVAIALIGAILGLVLALTGAGIAEMIDPAVRGVGDLQTLLSLAPLAVVPTIRNSVYVHQHQRILKLCGVAATFGVILLFVGIRVWVK
jgi:polysaccharide biosynthesis transport protein